MPPTGSSPLARGLPSEMVRHTEQWRIIPARAGFTRGNDVLRGQRRDHPRSRGVYEPVVPRMKALPGSSPLARGLLVLSVVSRLSGRIIPARAGFTAKGPYRQRIS